MENAPNFCTTCNIVRVGDPSYDGSPKLMNEDDMRSYYITGMCTECFKFANNGYTVDECLGKINKDKQQG